MDGHQYTALFEAPGGKPILTAYPDPLTGAEPWTIGLGHTGADVQRGTVWDEDRCLHAFYNDYGIACGAALKVIGGPTWTALNEPRRAVLADMAFNIGQHGLSQFVNMLAAIRRQDWSAAADALLDSDYARQTKTRARTNARTLVSGEWS